MPQTVPPAVSGTAAQELPRADSRRHFHAPGDLRRRRRPAAPGSGRCWWCWSLTGGSTFAFLSTEVGKNAMLDQQRQTMESFGVKLNEQAMQRDGRRRRSGPLLRRDQPGGVPAGGGAGRRGHRAGGLQRHPRRRCALQAGVRHRRAFGRHPRARRRSSRCRSTTRAKRCRARRTCRCFCRFSTRTRSWRGSSGRSICSASGGSSAWRSVSASVPKAHRSDRGHHARRLRGHRARHRRRQVGAIRSIDVAQEHSHRRLLSCSSAGAVVAANLYFKKDKGLTVTTEVIKARDLEAIVSASGKIQPKRLVNISAETPGRVVEPRRQRRRPRHEGPVPPADRPEVAAHARRRQRGVAAGGGGVARADAAVGRDGARPARTGAAEPDAAAGSVEAAADHAGGAREGGERRQGRPSRRCRSARSRSRRRTAASCRSGRRSRARATT